MKQTLVSIIINNYNYGRFLAEAIDSAINQTYPYKEIIVVDDGSTDNSLEVIASYGNQIISVTKENGGQASAVNKGFAKCQGEIIFMLDSDDIFFPNKVSKIVTIFENNTDIDWCFHPLRFSRSTDTGFEKIDDYPFPPKETSSTIDFKDDIIKAKFPAFGSPMTGTCYRKSLLEQILPMPEAIRICSDNYIRYLALSMSKGYFINEALSILRIHNNNNSSLRWYNDLRHVDAKYRIINSFYLRFGHPQLSKFANKLFGMALGSSQYVGKHRVLCDDFIEQYFNQISLIEKIEIKLRATYHLIKLTTQELKDRLLKKAEGRSI